MAMNKRDEGKKVNSNINVTPMVDVMLVLLIIFMVITPMINNKVNVDLPTVSNAVVMENANKEDAVTVAVTRDGRIFLGADPVSLMIWVQKSRLSLRTRPPRKFICALTTAPFMARSWMRWMAFAPPASASLACSPKSATTANKATPTAQPVADISPRLQL